MSISLRQPYTILAVLFMPIGKLSPKDFSIIWFSNHLTMNVPGAGYFQKHVMYAILGMYVSINTL